VRDGVAIKFHHPAIMPGVITMTICADFIASHTNSHGASHFSGQV